MKSKTGLRSQLTKGHIGISLVAILVFSAVFWGYYYTNAIEMEQQQLENLSDTASTQIESSLYMVDSIALQLSANSYISQNLEILRAEHSSDKSVDLFFMSEVNAFIWSYIIRTDIASRICIYDDLGDFISVGTTSVSLYEMEYTNSAYLQTLDEAFSQGTVTQYYIYPQDPLSNLEDAGYISAVRAVTSSSSSLAAPIIGYAEVQLSFRTIEKQFISLTQDSYQFALYDSETGTFLVGTDIFADTDFFTTFSSDGTITSYENGYLKTTTIPDTTLLLCVYTDASTLHASSTQMLCLLIAFGLTIIIFIVMIEVRFVNRMTAPLLQLFEQVRENGTVQRHHLLESSKNDELSELRDSFESMLDALQQSSDQLLGAQISKLRAQLLALQAQIDPHFIHNTLSVIVALAQEEDYVQVEQVALRLSEIIRYSSSFDEPMCTLAQETKHLENYLELLGVRYEENFSYQINGDSAEQNVRVPRFIAQPIAENALKYSLKQVDYHWHIDVQCESDAHFWRLIITDNGLGITQERADEIMKQTYLAINQGVDHLLEELKIGGLSLLNIAARLYLTYGDDMIFCICPAEEQGTKVILGGSIHAD